jgi:ubiquinone/menaquinone biosynthesis C-methylase UbiE
LHEVHQKVAEKYDEIYQKREFSNKLSKYRKIVLSYAEGRCLEVGIGTGENLKYYTKQVEVRF